MKFKISFFAIFFAIGTLFAQDPSRGETKVTVHGGKVDNIIAGMGHDIDITQNITQNILPKSQEYAEIKKSMGQLERRIKDKASQCEQMKQDGFPRRYISACISKLKMLNAERDSLSKAERQFREDVIRLAATFEKLALNSQRLRDAKALFDEGKIREADAILQRSEMEKETKYLLDRKKRSLKVISETDSLLKIRASEWLIKAQITKTRRDLLTWLDSTHYYFRRSIQCRRGIENQFNYALFLQNHNQYDSSLVYYQLAAKACLAARDTVSWLSTQNNLGNLYRDKNDYPKAEAAYLEALESYQRLAQTNPAAYERYVAITQTNLGISFMSVNKPEQAVGALSEALGIYRRFAVQNPNSYEIEVARSAILLAFLKQEIGDTEVALSLFREALQMADRHPHIPLARQISDAVVRSIGIEAADPVLWEWYQKAAGYEKEVETQTTMRNKAEPQEKVVGVWEEAFRRYSQNPRIRTFLTQNLGRLSWYRLFAEDFKGAEAAARRGLEVDQSETWILTNLATALLFQNRYKEAEPIYQQLKDQLNNEELTWIEGFLADLAELKAAGITHPDVDKVRALLQK